MIIDELKRWNLKKNAIFKKEQWNIENIVMNRMKHLQINHIDIR